MTPMALFITAMILAAGAVVVWAWFTVDRMEEGLRRLGGFEGKHFEIGPGQRSTPKARSDPPGIARL